MIIILKSHNPYFNRWFSAIQAKFMVKKTDNVTILILIDGFLQLMDQAIILDSSKGHNPYFNRWFSAIL